MAVLKILWSGKLTQPKKSIPETTVLINILLGWICNLRLFSRKTDISGTNLSNHFLSWFNIIKSSAYLLSKKMDIESYKQRGGLIGRGQTPCGYFLASDRKY